MDQGIAYILLKIIMWKSLLILVMKLVLQLKLKIDPLVNSFFLENYVMVGKSNRDLSYAFGAPIQNHRTLIGTIPRNKEKLCCKNIYA